MIKPTQSFDLTETDFKKPLKVNLPKFRKTHSLTFFVVDNQEDEEQTYFSGVDVFGKKLHQADIGKIHDKKEDPQH